MIRDACYIDLASFSNRPVTNSSTRQTMMQQQQPQADAERPAAPPHYPPNFARGAVVWSSDGDGSKQGFATRMSEIRSNKPAGASGSLNLTSI